MACPIHNGTFQTIAKNDENIIFRFYIILNIKYLLMCSL